MPSSAPPVTTRLAGLDAVRRQPLGDQTAAAAGAIPGPRRRAASALPRASQAAAGSNAGSGPPVRGRGYAAGTGSCTPGTPTGGRPGIRVPARPGSAAVPRRRSSP